MIGQKNVHEDRTCYMKIEHYNLHEWLATNPLDPDIHATHVSDKVTDPAEKERELKSLPKPEAIGEVEKRGTTVFFRRPEDGVLYIKSHMIKGYLKAAGDALRVESKKGDAEAPKPKAKGQGTKWGSIDGKIDNHVVVEPVELVIFGKDDKPKKDSDGMLVRSLRAETQQGPRVTVVKSEFLAALSKIEYTLYWREKGPITREMLIEMLDQGEIYFGIGQWRSVGKGRFTYRIVEEGKGIPPSDAKKELLAKFAKSKK